MGANNGSGQPLWFHCTKCRRNRTGELKQGRQFVPTGRMRMLPRSQQGHGGSRVLQVLIEYNCFDCDFTGWSRHIDLRSKFVTKFGQKEYDRLYALCREDENVLRSKIRSV